MAEPETPPAADTPESKESEKQEDSWLSGLGPGTLLLIVLTQLGFLLLLWVAWEWNWSWLSRQHFTPVMYGVMPLVVPWLGALGGVTNALYSLTQHWAKYDNSQAAIRTTERRTWAAWTVLQLITGAVFGSVAVMIVLLVTKTVTLDDSAVGTDISPAGMALLGTVSFAVGFRQITFQDLLTKLTDVILSPTAKEPLAFAVTPGVLNLKTTRLAPVSEKVTVQNVGQKRLHFTNLNVRLAPGTPRAFNFVLPEDADPGQTREIVVSFDPADREKPSGGWAGQLLVTFDSVTRVVELTGQDTGDPPASAAEAV